MKNLLIIKCLHVMWIAFKEIYKTFVESCDQVIKDDKKGK